MQKSLIGFIVNKKCLRKRLNSRIKMSLKHIMIQSVNKHCMCSFTVIVTNRQNRIHGILFWKGNAMKQNLYVQTKHLRLNVEASLFWRKHYVLILTPFHSFPFEYERETILLLICFLLLNFHFHLDSQECFYGGSSRNINQSREISQLSRGWKGSSS